MSQDEHSESNSSNDHTLRNGNLADSQSSGKTNDKGFKVHHYFDYVAGTSTGG